jgi:hypothetical protein
VFIFIFFDSDRSGRLRGAGSIPVIIKFGRNAEDRGQSIPAQMGYRRAVSLRCLVFDDHLRERRHPPSILFVRPGFLCSYARCPTGGMLMHRAGLIAIGALGFVVNTAFAAVGPYDGRWIGTAPDAGQCGVLTVTLMITDNLMTGTVNGKRGSPTIVTTSVASDGTAKAKYAQFEGTVKLSGTQFTGSFDTFCGIRAVTGTKAQ